MDLSIQHAAVRFYHVILSVTLWDTVHFRVTFFLVISEKLK
jgi:hypothetical protein